MIHILTDSCVDLTPELIQRFNLETIPLTVSIGNQTFSDGVDLKTEDLFRLVEERKQLPKTAAPSIGAFVQFFDREGTVIYSGIGSRLSVTFQNAIAARNELPHRDIRLVDSSTLSAAIGILVIRAAEMRDQGASADEIVAMMEAIRSKIHVSFVIDTLDYIHMGGRCTAIEHIFGSMLKIHPVIEVKRDGTLGIREKTRGSRRKGMDAILANFRKNLPSIDTKQIFVTHTCQPEDVAYVISALRQLADIDELFVTGAGATIASHCGPNTIGIGYIEK